MDFWEFGVFILGCLVGSFVNVLIDRIPAGESVMRGRSHCDHCRRTIAWYELVPVISWIFQRGKSRCCRKHLSLQYPLIELINGIGFVCIYFFSFTYHLSLITLIFSLSLFSSAVALFMTDVKSELLPTPLLWAAGLSAIAGSFFRAGSAGQFCLYYVLPAVATALFFHLLRVATSGKAMGDGDVPLAFILGIVTGYPLVVVSLYLAFLTGAFFGVILILGRMKTLKSHIPFGPFLIIGGIVALQWGQQLIHIWKSLL